MRYTIALIVLISCAPALAQHTSIPPDTYVRPGFALTVACEVPGGNARFMCVNPDLPGTLYVTQPGAGKIIALRDTTGDGYYDRTSVLIENQPSVHGMFYDAKRHRLWFTRSDAVLHCKIDADGKAIDITTVLDHLPRGGHWWRSILIHGDRIYTSIGDSGNINDETNTDRQKIWSYALDGSDKKLFISGIRNTEKLVVRPGTDEIWGMDHGSDWFGQPLGDKPKRQPITDYNPPDEMNRYVEGQFYGHPFITGNRVPRYEFIKRPDLIELAAKTTVPEWCMPAHCAPNAMCFYTGDQFPAQYKGDAFVAMHGSWNRSRKDGYGVVRVLFDHADPNSPRFGHPYGMITYVSFMRKDGSSSQRPVDVATDLDGSLLISEEGGRIYRLAFTGEQ